MKALNASQATSNARLQFELIDHFASFTDTQVWTETSSDTTAVIAMTAAAGGGITLTTDATNNNECYLESTNELFKFLANRPIHLQALISYTEANTDDANVMVGLMDAPGANSIVDDGAGPKASYSGAVIYKVDGGTTWLFETSNATTQTNSTSTTTAGGGVDQLLEIEVIDVSGTAVDIIPKINGQQLIDSTSGDLIKHTVLLASATEMAIVVGNKAGGSNSEVLTLRMISATQKY